MSLGCAACLRGARTTAAMLVGTGLLAARTVRSIAACCAVLAEMLSGLGVRSVTRRKGK